MPKFMIGCDPEVFVRDASGNLVTAHGLVPGSKTSAHRVENGAIQVDGMALEFNIDPVESGDFESFNRNIVEVVAQLKKAIPVGYGMVVDPSVEFDRTYYDTNVPDDAKELGCDPDFCAYSSNILEPNPRPDGATNVRSAAGHIHIGWGADIPADNPEHIEICRAFVRNLDVFVGLAMTVLDRDARRRTLYGKAGAYRPKSYGVEYRTPSNVWIRSKGARRFIHSMVVKAITDMSRGTSSQSYVFAQANGDDFIRNIIDTGDAETAEMLLSGLYINVPAALKPTK